ncbi:MAG: glycosyltransferase [Oscillospiraceae bacterium]|jgi:glycosyltransferase involved in cell wall biosynthesis|nr:glycosyltransferase [Oscillospiraceae bacterium]
MKIVAVTWGRNCAATLPRAVDSVLGQSYGNVDYYLVDNASDDNTLEIMNRYAASYERVKVVANSQNDMRVLFTLLPDFYARYSDDDALIILDADDEYTADCFQSLADSIGEQDFLCCGSDILDAESGDLIEQRTCAYPNKPFFMQIYNFLRTFWGKLIPFRTLKRCSFDIPAEMVYGIDTLFALEVYKNSENYGVLPGTHHRYYLSRKSVSYRFEPLRFKWDLLIADRAFATLEARGELTAANRDYIRKVRSGAMWETSRAISRSGKALQIPALLLKTGALPYFIYDTISQICNKYFWRKK